MTLRNAVRVFAPALMLCVSCSAFAQQRNAACGTPPIVPPDSRPNYFSEQQEEWLGDATAEMVEAEFRLVRDPAQNAYLQAIVDRLAATLPDTHINFRVQIIDSSEVNGFSLAGGRIYLTRKLAAEAKSDDELASVLGHEMGHIASHQFAFETTRDMKRLLGVTSVVDRADVFAKVQKLQDARIRSHSSSGGDDDDKQEEADRIGVYVVAAAGYRPQANAEFWDRMFFTKGKKGGAFSDFLGFSKPTERRLGKIQKLIAGLPPGCGGERTVRAEGFEAWHGRVMANRAVEAAHIDGAREVKLTPPLRMDMDRLRFSPDGSKILAQDESTVFVLDRDPLKVDFKIDAPNALGAEFSPDSKRVVFTTHGLHTEEWSIAEQKMLQVHEPLTKDTCVQTKLSPDGRTLVCLSLNSETYWMELSLLDSESGNVLWDKKNLFEPSIFFSVMMYLTHESEAAGELVPSSFSADGNYLLIGPGDKKVAFDLRTRTQVKIGGPLVGRATGVYAFLGSDRVAGVNAGNPKDSGIYSFPEGKLLKKVSMPFSVLSSVSATDGSPYVIGDGFKDFDLSLADLDKSVIVLGSATYAVDLWNGIIADENKDGSIGVSKLEPGKLTVLGNVRALQSQLAPLRSVEISPDGRYLAASTRSRGAVWDLTTGRQVILGLGFRAGWNGASDVFMEFPKHGKIDAQVLDLSLATKKAAQVSYPLKEMHIQFGMLYEWKDAGKQAKQLVVHRMTDGSELWTRTFSDGVPAYTASYGWKDLLFSYRLNSSYAKSQIKAEPKLASEAVAVKKRDDGRLVEVVDKATGKTIESAVVEMSEAYTGAGGLNRVGEQLYATTGDHRTQVYSLSNGQELRQMFGTVIATDETTARVCLTNRQDEAAVYDPAGQELMHLQIGSPLRFTSFVNSGSSLLLLGADQVIRIVPVRTGPPMAVASAK
ncbi:MAG TPA: M48 family metalloprotease [Acidobacteriaceae bacterium]|nr:M48 family metalloprotease [Acidobacteriaceae bacterium]